MPEPIRWRVDHHGAHDVALEVGPGSTVGEVAAALAARLSPVGLPPGPAGDTTGDAGCALPSVPCATVVCDGRAADADALAVEAAPASGSTVTLRPVGAGTSGGPTPAPAPVHLLVRGDVIPLRYGTNRAHPGVVVEIDREPTVRASGPSPVSLDGEQVRDTTPAHDGALLRCAAWTATLRITGPLRPPPPAGPWQRHAARRSAWPPPSPRDVDLPLPPEAVRRPGLPVWSTGLPLALGAAVWLIGGSALWAGFMAMGAGYVVAAALEARRDGLAEARHRTASFQAALASAEQVLDQLADEERERDARRHPDLRELLGWFDPPAARIWERHDGHPAPLTVRLGTAVLPADATPRTATTGHEDLDRVLRRHARHRRPVTVDLAGTGGLAVLGDPAASRQVLDAALFQLAVMVPPEEVALAGDPCAPEGPAGWARWLPHRGSSARTRVVVLTGDGPGGDGATLAPGTPVLWSAADAAGLPSSIRAVLHLHPGGGAELCVDHDPPVEVDLELTAPAGLEPAARRLSGLRRSAPRAARVTPTLSGMGVPRRPDDLLRRWSDAGQSGDLVVPLGVGDGGGVVHIDLAHDGPHALVAGTTGSGKSELLRSWVAALAGLHPPDRLHVLLVDYKGGASFGPLHRLPHCTGLVTDLSADMAARAVGGLRAELRRRERVLAAAGAASAADLPAEAGLPALVVVVDEFATMVEEAPVFLDGLLDVARRGRSLGIHVVLATQRPAGVVSDAIRANTSLRIALRLPDTEDSIDVVGVADAARLPRDEPGRAIVRLDHDRVIGLRAAYSGGPPGDPATVVVRPLHRRPGLVPAGRPPVGGPSELDSLVTACTVAADRLGVARARPPWSPPLPTRVVLPGGEADRLVVGVVDLPAEQRHDRLVVDTARGGILAVGAPRSGTSTTLATLARAAAAAGRTVHVIDAGGGLAHLGSVVKGDDHELVHRLLWRLRHGPGRDAMLVIDDFAAFEHAQSRVNRGAAIDAVVALAGRTAGGVLVATSARRRADLPAELLAALGNRLVHRCAEHDAALSWDAPEWLCHPDLPPGRVVLDGRLAQVGLLEHPARPADRPPRLPDSLDPTQLERADAATNARRAPGGGLQLPIGLDADSLEVAEVDLRRHHLLVAGSTGTGRSTALAALARAAARRGTRVLLGVEGLDRLAAEAPVAAPAALLVLDDLEEVLDEPALERLLGAVLAGSREVPWRVVAAGEAGVLWRTAGPVLDRLRSGRCGLLLGGDAHRHDALLHVELTPRDDLPPTPGRGWLVQRGRPRPVQVARPG